MMPTCDEIRCLFEHLEAGDTDAFFAHVADDVHWTVMGHHPLAGTYADKTTFLQSTFGRLQKIMRDGVKLRLERLFLDGNHAIAELTAISTALDGRAFDNTYCWVLRFDGELIVEARAYLDSALVADTLTANEPAE